MKIEFEVKSISLYVFIYCFPLAWDHTDHIRIL